MFATRYLYAIALLLVPVVLMAEEAAVTLPPLSGDAPAWAQMIWLAFGALIFPYVISFLRSKKNEANAEAEKFKLDANASLLEQKNYLIDKRVIPYLWSTASHLAEKELPTILQAVMVREEGEKKFDWKDYAGKLKAELLEDLKSKFATESIDIVKILGEKYLGELLDRAIAKAIPWLPQATQPIVENLAEGRGNQIANMVIDRGLDYAKDRWFKGE